MRKQRFLPFNDGIVDIYTVENVAFLGDAVSEKLTKYNRYRYKNQTVGMSRYFEAMQNNVMVSLVILIPTIDGNISTQNVAVIGGKQYVILQVQRIDDARPPHLKLTLSEVEENYEFKRI